MARTASVSDLAIYTTVHTLTQRHGQRPTPYAIRKALIADAPHGTAPSYGLIHGALERLDALLATGSTLEALASEGEAQRAVGNTDVDDQSERVSTYLAELVRPIAEKLLKDAQLRATSQETELTQLLDEAYRERDELQVSARTLGDQLLTTTRALTSTKAELATAIADSDTLRATTEALHGQVEHLKALMTRDRDALERERDNHRTALAKTSEDADRRVADVNAKLDRERETVTLLQDTIARLGADNAGLTEKLAGTTQQVALAERTTQEAQREIRRLQQEHEIAIASLAELQEANTALEHSVRALQINENHWRTQAAQKAAATEKLQSEKLEGLQREYALKARSDELQNALNRAEKIAIQRDQQLSDLLVKLGTRGNP